jgi:hypothetical protein
VKLPLYNYHIRPGGMLFGRSTRLHSELWRRIRSKHPEAYKLPAVLRLWWTTRDGSGRVPLLRALSQYAAAQFLPDAWFNNVIGVVRRRRLLGPGKGSACA